MSDHGKSRLPELIESHQSEILADWVREQLAATHQAGRIKEQELRAQCTEFLSRVQNAAHENGLTDLDSSKWTEVREFLGDISRSRGQQGFSPSETASFVLSLKKPLFTQLNKEFAHDSANLAKETWLTSELLDKFGLYTMEVYQKTREEVILRQQQEMMELSTPVVKLWEGVLALPLIGTLDSNRTQVVMESLLQRIVDTGAEIAILDITGVPTVDTLVAQHLIKAVTAARLMGADCIISGIRPQIAQTIVHLGVDLGSITTKATLADALSLAFRRIGFSVSRIQAAK